MPELAKRKKKRFTIFDLTDKRALREWLGLTEEALRKALRYSRMPPPWRHGTNNEHTVDRLFDEWFDAYRRSLQPARKEESVRQFVGRLLKEEFGLRKGTVKERIEQVKMLRPDLYQE